MLVTVHFMLLCIVQRHTLSGRTAIDFYSKLLVYGKAERLSAFVSLFAAIVRQFKVLCVFR